MEHDQAIKEAQYQLDLQRRKHDRELQEMRGEHLSERKKRDAESTLFEYLEGSAKLGIWTLNTVKIIIMRDEWT